MHAQVLAQAKQKEEELLTQINTLQTKNATAQSALYHKYKNALYEIEDLKREHEYEKETLLDSIRDQQKEIDFYEEVLSNILSPEEFMKIRSHTVWSEQLNKYKIPPFIFKEKMIKFPNLSYAQSQGLNNQEKQLRELEIDCGLIEEQGSDEDSVISPWESEGNYEAKHVQSLAPKKNLGLKLNVKPVIMKEEEEKEEEKKETKAFPKLFVRNNRNKIVKNLLENDLDQALETPIEKKKNYLRTIDTGFLKYLIKI